MATVKDIAQKAGVSPATVSLALNHRRGVSNGLARHIRQVAFEMGYHKGLLPKPNIEKRARARICTLQIVKHGQILNARHQDFVDGYIMGMMHYAMHNMVQLEVRTVPWDRAGIQKAIGEVFDQEDSGNEGKRALAVIAAELDEEDVMQLTASMTLPIVFLDILYSRLPFDFIDMDNSDIMYEIADHLKSQGHKQISFVGCEPDTPHFRMRQEAFGDALHSRGLSAARPYVINPYPEALEFARQLESTDEAERPTAMVCCNDLTAYNCMKTLKSLGYRIPEDMAVVGFDNLAASAYFEPPLSSVEVPRREIGARVVHRLLEKMDLIEQGNISFQAPIKQKLSGRLILRESSLGALKASYS